MKPRWMFDFVDAPRPRPLGWPALAVAICVLATAAWWLQQRQLEANALAQAMAQAQQRLQAAERKAKDDAQAAQAAKFDDSIWDVAWLDERLRELEACVPGAAQLQTLKYTTSPRAVHITVQAHTAAGLDSLLACLAPSAGAPTWRVGAVSARPVSGPLGGLEATLQAP